MGRVYAEYQVFGVEADGLLNDEYGLEYIAVF